MNLSTSSHTTSPVNNMPLTIPVHDRLLTTTDAAVYLGLTRDKLANLRHDAGAPDWVQLGRTIRYIPDDLDWWLEQSRNHPSHRSFCFGTTT